MCLKCNKDGYNQIFEIKDRKHGSVFDLDDIIIPLCTDCINKLNLKKEWFENVIDDMGNYQFEDELENLINMIGVDKVILTNICSSSIITTK